MITGVALDLGSTSIKAACLDRQGNLQRLFTKPAPVIEPVEGRYESSALEYAEIAEQVLATCIASIAVRLPLGISCQRSSFLIWNQATGVPLTPLISWQDDRGKRRCRQLHASDGKIRELTGLRLTPYYFAPKLSVLLRQHPSWREKLLTGEWLVGTLDTYLIWRWTGQRHFVTDASMAARTLLMDIHTLQWSDALCALFELPSAILPRIVPSTGLNLQLTRYPRLTLQASIGDQSSALFATLANPLNEALINLGTGGFVIRPLLMDETPPDGYLQTLLYQHDKQPAQFACEGTINSIASALADYPVTACRFEQLAQNSTFCLAEPSGLGAPYFRIDWGIHFSQPVKQLSPEQIAALLLEGIIFRVVRILEQLNRQKPLVRAYLSGGLSDLAVLRQGIAQCSPIPVGHLSQKEASLRGAAMLACGLKATASPDAHPIEITQPNTALVEKYRHWQVWLDGLLAGHTTI